MPTLRKIIYIYTILYHKSANGASRLPCRKYFLTKKQKSFIIKSKADIPFISVKKASNKNEKI